MKNICGHIYFRCWWEKKSKKIITGQELVQVENEPERYIPIYGQKLVYDRFNFGLLDPRDVFTSNEYTYSLQEKKWIIIRFDSTIEELEDNKELMGYTNLDTLKLAHLGSFQTETKGSESSSYYTKEKKPESPSTPIKNWMILERHGKYWADVITRNQLGEPLEIRPGIDEQGKPVLDANGRAMRVSKRVEEVITAPVIRSQLGKRFQIEGLDSVQEANELSLLLRAGAFAAPVEIIEERTVGPSLGADNIAKGFHSTWVGFAAIAFFMSVYYVIFGLISVAALAVNVLLLVALLSMLQATLTLPGMAGIALTVGMAIDANVLINERIREELRNGNTPQASIYAGYERAFGTILDSNVTNLIAGLALFMFGTGPIKGFAVVLCLGILTSMFSAVMVSRSMVNLMYGGRRKLEKIPIGNTAWKETSSATG